MCAWGVDELTVWLGGAKGAPSGATGFGWPQSFFGIQNHLGRNSALQVVRTTTSHSRPLAVWMVLSVTLSSFLPTLPSCVHATVAPPVVIRLGTGLARPAAELQGPLSPSRGSSTAEH